MDVIINLNKPINMSSQQAVLIVKKLFSARKAGHAGTLDPIAAGILIVCLNQATKVTRFLSDLDKEYIVGMKLGERTDTGDLTGKLLEKKDFLSIKNTDVYKILKNFVGDIKQIPPMYSAVKVKGQPLYKLARMGIEIQRPERPVQIYGIDVIRFEQPYLHLKILCSKGTYIRTLCDDIGNDLHVGAHVISLKRTRVGKFRIEDSVSVEELKCGKNVTHSVDSAISHLSAIMLDEESCNKVRKGIPVIMVTEKQLVRQVKHFVRLKDPENRLFAIGRLEQDRITVERLLN